MYFYALISNKKNQGKSKRIKNGNDTAYHEPLSE